MARNLPLLKFMAYRTLVRKVEDTTTKRKEAEKSAPSKPKDPPKEVKRDLKAEYEEAFGKKPHHRMSDETIAERLQEHADAERDNKKRS